MIHAALHLLLYALIAGFSALAFAATLAVMQAGRLKTLGFGIGFVSGQVLTCSLLVGFGVAVTGATRRTHSTLLATLELLLALLLIAAASVPARTPVETEGGSERTKVLERLSRLRLVTTSIAGFMLGVGGPKRLVLTSLAATAITTAGVGVADEAVLVVLYCALATALVWGPARLRAPRRPSRRRHDARPAVGRASSAGSEDLRIPGAGRALILDAIILLL